MAAPRQEVVTLPLPPTLRQSLVAAGFRTTADLHGIGPVDLSAGRSVREVGKRLVVTEHLSKAACLQS
jgi:hypothetical protein